MVARFAAAPAMRLYLSSYRIGTRGAELAALFPAGKRVAIIRNALDFSDDVERHRIGRAREIADLAALGLSGTDFDLREFFGSPARLSKALEDFDGLWVVGGNTFVLRRAMADSGLDAFLRDRAADDTFVYAGYSAGACVLAPTLKGIHLADQPEVVPPGYRAEVPWDGLGLVPFSIVPHYRSDHPESPLMESVVEYLEQHQIRYLTLRDGDVYIGKSAPQ